MPSSKHVLLTGAGFTANFGTPLATGVYNDICNHRDVNNDSELRKLARNTPNYEQLYNLVMNGGYNDSQKEAMQRAVSAAYEKIDNILINFHRGGPASLNNVNIHSVNKFLNRFAKISSRGYYFTLNQDLFLERHYCDYITRPIIPGFQTDCVQGFQTCMTDELADKFNMDLPDTVNESINFSKGRGQFAYIKLHGSMNWQSPRQSKQQKMVIGTNKTQQILQEPLLKWYFKEFKDKLREEKIKLLCIGYGFADEHVNDVIADAILKSDMKLYVMDPSLTRDDFNKRLDTMHQGKTLVEKLVCYFNFSLRDICPTYQNQIPPKNGTVQMQELENKFFSMN